MVVGRTVSTESNAVQQVTLREAIHRRHSLSPKHLEAFRKILLKNMRSEERKHAINQYRTVADLAQFIEKWWTPRFVFRADGGCTYYPSSNQPEELNIIREDLIKGLKG